MNPHPLGAVLDAKLSDDTRLEEIGKKVGRLYSDHGLPIDIALSRLDLTKEQKIAVLDGACQWLIEHRRNSGATQKAIDRRRHINRRMMEDFIKKGETDVY